MNDPSRRGGFSLKRWSQRKHAARREAVAPASDPAPPPAAAVPSGAAPTGAATATSRPPEGVAALPPIDSLTFDADFTGFMQPDVDPSLKNAALKKLFADPRFNVMDGLDTYIDDYSKPDPIDAETVAGLMQSRYLFNPPRTRVNERGEVEDVPPDEPKPPEADAPGEDVARPAAIAHEDPAPGEAPAPGVPTSERQEGGR